MTPDVQPERRFNAAGIGGGLVVLIMGVLMLAAPKDTKILVSANGADAEEALVAIGDLIAGKFGEE